MKATDPRAADTRDPDSSPTPACPSQSTHSRVHLTAVPDSMASMYARLKSDGEEVGCKQILEQLPSIHSHLSVSIHHIMFYDDRLRQCNGQNYEPKQVFQHFDELHFLPPNEQE